MKPPSRSLLYVACADSHETLLFHIDPASGTLEEVERFALTAEAHTMAVSPDARFLVAALRPEPFTLVSHRIGADGRLTTIGSAPLPGGATYLAFDRGGRFLFTASYGSDLVCVSPIDGEGRVSSPVQVIEKLPHAHAAITDPDSHFVFAPLLGADRIDGYAFDPTTGRLTPTDPPCVAAATGSGPRHPVWHPSGRQLFCINELDGSISAYGFDKATGRLTHTQSLDAMPAAFAEKPWAADLRIRPDGRFLYGCDRRSSSLSRVSVDQATGRLALLEVMPTEMQPRGMAMAHDGRFLLVAGQLSNHITVYAIDPATGALTSIGRHATGKNPLWMELVPGR
jgi:6-phosphogluconolactonase